MPKKVAVYNIFIASPSDAKEERDVIKHIIYEWNSLNFNSEVRFEPILWESHSRPDSGRGQEVINQQLLNKSDFAISIFKTRLGTGTLEEVNLFKDNKKPIMVYFSEESISDDLYNSSEYKELQKWKHDVAWNDFLADSYSSIDELKDKIFKNLFKLKDAIEHDDNFILTQDILNYTKKETSETYKSNSVYDVKKDRKRLRIQAKAIEKFDNKHIQKVMEYLNNKKKTIRILDVGCSDGYLTVSRFYKYENIQVLGIDISKEQIKIANSENFSKKFNFMEMDITENIDKLEESFDLIFSAYTMHHLKNSDIVISKLWNKLNKNGVMMIRSPDDGLKVNFPFDQDLEFLLNTTDKVSGSSDRIHGRKVYTFMKRCRPRPEKVNLKYFIDDTSDLCAEKRENYFEHYYGYRNKYAKLIAEKSNNPDDIKLSNKLTDIMDQQRERFESSSEVYSISVAILSIAYK